MTEPTRRTWPGPMSTAGVGEGHSHDLPEPLLRRVRLMGWAVVIFGVCLAALSCLFVLLIQARSAERDSEARRIAEQNRLSWCTALDTLPQGIPALDRLRAIYHCGPGLPLDQLTPDEQAQLSNNAPRSVAPSPAPAPASAVDPPFGSGAVLNPPRATTPPAPPRPTLPPRPTVPPEPDPLVDLEPITDPLCDALGVCV